MRAEGGLCPPALAAVVLAVIVAFATPALGAHLCVPGETIAHDACGATRLPRNDSLDEFALPTAEDESLGDTAIESLIAPSAGETQPPGEPGRPEAGAPPTPEVSPR